MSISAFLVTVAVTIVSPGQAIPDEEVKLQNEKFHQYWGQDLEWRFDQLPEKSSLADFRTPYSGHIYPDRAGGTGYVLRKYDIAFHGRRGLASAFEQKDIEIHKEKKTRSGPFGFIRRTVEATPGWAGHCNGWAAAAIRHAEPKNNVTVNGVTFTPADIKGLLAEAYTYNDPDYLCGYDFDLNPAVLHVVLTNWLGRAAHPLAMEADPGSERWNYPVHGYSVDWNKIDDRSVSVSMSVEYITYSNGEYQVSPKVARRMNFFYRLDLDEQQRIVGGAFYRQSAMIDLIWVPVGLKPGGKPGNESGNPYMDVDELLSIWRKSVPDETRQKWVNIDPAKEDLQLSSNIEVPMLPVGYQIAKEEQAEESSEEASE